MPKDRAPIPQEVSVDVLFLHDHTCCVCRESGKAVQIHHIDDDPSNNSLENLAVLCLQHHNDTQITGGFGRKLQAAEVHRYRDDWLERVENRREEADKIASERMGGVQSTAEPGANWTRPPQAMLNAYIEHLPELLKAAFAKARSEWDKGTTARVRNATSETIDILQRVLVYLANWYPPGHFEDKPAEVYFSEFIASRYAWHRALNTPDEAGSGGTIAGVLAGGGALDDVLTAVADVVAAQAPGEFDFKSWRARWEKAEGSPERESPLEIIFDPNNPGKKFWSIEPMKDESGKQIAGSYWEYRAIIKNKSARTVRNVKVTVEAIGAMPSRPEPSNFDINKKPLIDMTPNEETLAVIRRWYNPPRVAGMVIGAGVYGPIKMTASADDVLPTTKFFQFEPDRTPMIFEMNADAL
jgi:hypothetical protein